MCSRFLIAILVVVTVWSVPGSVLGLGLGLLGLCVGLQLGLGGCPNTRAVTRARVEVL